jgi:multidrug resistance efflux pump
MGLARMGLGFFGVVALLAATLAAAAIWLMLTDPVTVADAVSGGDVTPLVRALGAALYDAVKGILGYL